MFSSQNVFYLIEGKEIKFAFCEAYKRLGRNILEISHLRNEYKKDL